MKRRRRGRADQAGRAAAAASLLAELNDDVRSQVVRRFADCNRAGHPYRCRPSNAGEDRSGSIHKIVYRSLANAQEAARRLSALDGHRQWVYACPYSRHGHYHLTSQPPRATNTTLPHVAEEAR